MSRVWRSPDKQNYIIASKGSPEAIINLCHISSSEKAKIIDTVKRMSEKGLRVLGGARATYSKNNLPNKQHDFEFEFVGLYGFIDPVRSTASDAVSEAYGAGIRVIVITGDYSGTAQYVARKIGIKNPENFIVGEQLEKMDLSELREKIKTINIFARVVPEQKLKIVNALKANGEIVAMTGDGVNDAQLLNQHISELQWEKRELMWRERHRH